MTSSTPLVERAWNRETDELDLGELFPPLRTYCPILYGERSIHSHPLQCLFLLLEGEEAFYGGAAGGGKSAALLAGALQHVDVPAYRALILRRTYAQLSKGDALIPLSHEWLSTTDARWNEQKKTWKFPSGATLEFGHVKDEASKYDYQGAAYQFVGFDELTQFTESIYEYIAFSRQRRRIDIADIGLPVRIRSTANPGGIGHAWVKSRFIAKPHPDVVFIPAKVRDNPGLDADDYEQRLRKLSPTLARQLLDGDWGAFEGQAFEQYSEDVHTVPVFDVPAGWERFESVDPGINNPTAWLAWAIDTEGNHIVYDSVYTDQGEGLPSEVAPRVLARRGYWRSDVAHTDPSAWNTSGILNRWGQPASLATEYEDNSVPLTRANNDPRAGYARLRELIEPREDRLFPDWHPRARTRGAPRLYVVKTTCPDLAEQLAAAPLQPIEKRLAGEIVDPDWESAYGHAVAAARYGAMSRPDASLHPPAPPAPPRTLAALEEDRASRSVQANRSRYQY